jgi:hypothetical protein
VKTLTRRLLCGVGEHQSSVRLIFFKVPMPINDLVKVEDRANPDVHVRAAT